MREHALIDMNYEKKEEDRMTVEVFIFHIF